MRHWAWRLGLLPAVWLAAAAVGDVPVLVEGQPLAANSARVREALEALGAPLAPGVAAALRKAETARDAARIQEILDPLALVRVTVNPETRVKVERGEGPAVLQQGGYTPALVKVVNLSTSTAPLRISSPQAGPVYAGMSDLSAQRQRQPKLRENENTTGSRERFLDVEMAAAPPMLPRLSGLEVGYALALIYSSEAGKREATLGFDVGQGTQDLGFRGETPVLFQVRPAVKVALRIRDHDGKPTTARLEFRDAGGRVHPPQAKRLAPDFFFQKQIYRHNGETVLLPPGELVMESSRGPEYLVQRRKVRIPAAGAARLDVALDRWIDTEAAGYFSGDHHIHGAGCGHYTYPTEGVSPEDMFRNVKGEGLNVGCVLTWGPCYEFQRSFFSPGVDRISEPLTVMKYDVEVSGFGSQALGHVCLLNLRDQTYPGSEGTKTKGWPTWTTPVLRWAKSQGAVTGYAHAASGVHIDPAAAGKRLLERRDADQDGRLSAAEVAEALLPEPFAKADGDRDGWLSKAELIASHVRAAEELPNLAIPEMNGVGAMEACVTVANGLCDFISSMDTARIQEWNTWYHLLNCGFPVKTSGETDFPCMSGTRVGQGRVYVKLGKVDRLDFGAWCEGLRAGRSYVSDGYAHALNFAVDGREAGSTLELSAPGEVQVTAKVAFSAQTPLDVAHGTLTPPVGRRLVGDTVNKHDPLTEGSYAAKRSRRKVELVMNGKPVAFTEVPADGKLHEVRFRVRAERSSWLALRQFPQLHTNPVNVRVAGAPIRASRDSALWCIGVIDQLWRNRERAIIPAERDEARQTFERTKLLYRRIAEEAR
ncbi:MAG: CehA/McbA family metallohydrolase [Actinomycetota bacterium]